MDDPFDVEMFSQLAALESGSFWFEHRSRLILWALGVYAPGCADLLEIGCGTGFVLRTIHTARPEIRLTGGDLYKEGLTFARVRVPSATISQMDACSLPYQEAFDAVCAFDVLEHIPDDRLALKNLRTALRPGGTLLVTVPQHPWLWSANDVAAHHQRRYTRRELVSRVRVAGFRVCYVGSFVSTLLPIMALSRLRRRSGKGESLPELNVAPLVNRLLAAALLPERVAISARVSLPVGGSLLLAARC